MHLESVRKLFLLALLPAFFSGASVSSLAQVVPAASEPSTPLELGGGFSYYDVDWGHTRMDGITLWADYRPPRLPRLLDGLGVEAEGRDVQWNPGDKPSGFRQASVGGGPIYFWNYFPSFKVYLKGDIEFGGFNFGAPLGPGYSHDTRTVYAPGLGVEIKVARHIWARVDYEYQFWPQLTGNSYLNPQGFTAGAMYDFRRKRRR